MTSLGSQIWLEWEYYSRELLVDCLPAHHSPCARGLEILAQCWACGAHSDMTVRLENLGGKEVMDKNRLETKALMLNREAKNHKVVHIREHECFIPKNSHVN